MGLKNKQAIVRDYWEQRKTVLEAKVWKDYNAWEGGREEESN